MESNDREGTTYADSVVVVGMLIAAGTAHKRPGFWVLRDIRQIALVFRIPWAGTIFAWCSRF